MSEIVKSDKQEGKKYFWERSFHFPNEERCCLPPNSHLSWLESVNQLGARCTPCSTCCIFGEPPALPPLDVASMLLSLAAVLRTHFQSETCGLIEIYVEEMRISLPSWRGLVHTPVWHRCDCRLDRRCFFDFSWWNERKREGPRLLSARAWSLHTVCTPLASRHFDLSYTMHFYASVESCTLLSRSYPYCSCCYLSRTLIQ